MHSRRLRFQFRVAPFVVEDAGSLSLNAPAAKAKPIAHTAVANVTGIKTTRKSASICSPPKRTQQILPASFFMLLHLLVPLQDGRVAQSQHSPTQHLHNHHCDTLQPHTAQSSCPPPRSPFQAQALSLLATIWYALAQHTSRRPLNRLSSLIFF